MTDDRFAEFKGRQREMWSSFAPTAALTTPVAGHLVEFASVRAGEKVLDVGCGTGVVAVTVALRGAEVSGLDLTPALLDHARENAKLAGCDVSWTEGDAERLPYDDGAFDVVLSQFGHMFAPRPEVALAEMRRVLKPGGRVAFATWPPEHFVGRFFAMVGKYSPSPPEGAAPPPLWGAVPIVTERLSAAHFHPPFFERGVMKVPALSLPHLWQFMSASIGPLQKIVERLASEPEKLNAVRQEMMDLARPYFWDNILHQDYLLTRAKAK